MKAGSFTAQLGVRLTVTAGAITLSASTRSYQLERENFTHLEETSLLKIFKRGIRFCHRQQDLPGDLVFYPSGNREELIEKLQGLGWS